MKSFIGIALLCTLCCVFAKTTPDPPLLPTKFLALGNFWSIDKDGALKGYGTFNMKYDWDTGLERSDTFLSPESDYDTTYMVIWKNKESAIFAFLDEKTGDINCTKPTHGDSKMLSPDTLQKACKFESFDVYNGLVHKWDCKLKEVNFKVWSHMHTKMPLKIEINYKTKVKVAVEFDHFHEVTKFDENLFVPPDSWECPSM